MANEDKGRTRKRRTPRDANAELERAAQGESTEDGPEPEAKEPEPVEPAKEPEPVVVPEVKPVESRVALRVYLAACTHRWEQMAGFKVEAKNLGLGPRSMREWEEAYQTHLKRPVI